MLSSSGNSLLFLSLIIFHNSFLFGVILSFPGQDRIGTIYRLDWLSKEVQNSARRTMPGYNRT
jgi:hypothetical protein